MQREFISLAQGIAASPYDLFQILIAPQHCLTIAYRTNIKTHDGMGREQTTKQRRWNDATGSGIEGFSRIL